MNHLLETVLVTLVLHLEMALEEVGCFLALALDLAVEEMEDGWFAVLV